MAVLAGTVYATSTDLTNIGLLGGALANVPAGSITEALQAASAVADSYLQGQFVLPITQWGYDLVRAVCNIAAWDLMAARGYSPQSPDDHIRQRYEDALTWLDEVSKSTQTPVNILDSTSGITPDEGATEGGYDGMSVTSTAVRGWTDRGVGSPDTGDGWNS